MDYFRTAKEARYIIDNITANKEMIFAKTAEIVGLGDIPIFLIKFRNNSFVIQELSCVTDDNLKYNTYKIKTKTLIRHIIMYTVNGKMMSMENDS